MRLLTWNIQWGRGLDGRVDLARTLDVLRAHAAEVICLQEVAVNHPGLPGGAGEDQPARLEAGLPGYEAIYAPGSDLTDGAGGRRQFGVMLLSVFPVLQVFRHQLPFPPDPVVPAMPRVALEAVIQAPFAPLRVVTTHLEYYSARQRSAQIDHLRALQAEGQRHAVAPRSTAESDPPFAVLPRGEYAVFCGDFNCPAGSAEYRQLVAPIADDVPPLCNAWHVAHPGVPPAPTFGLHEASFLSAPATYDFCFVSANLARRVRNLTVDAASRASDHQPLLLDLA